MKLLRRHAALLLFLTQTLAIGFFQTLNNTDKLWNYVFAENIASGLLPYQDFNLLQTPFSCLVNALALFLFGHHMLVIELLGSLLFTLICLRLYRIGRLLGCSFLAALLIPQVFLLLFCYNVFFEYSCLILLLQLCLISADLRALRGKNERWGAPSYQLLIGLYGGLAMMCKQSFGLFVAASSCLALLYTAFCLKKTRQEGLFLLLFRGIGILIPNSIFLFYLLFTGTLADFWDLAVAGISTFSSSYSYFTLAQENLSYLLACIGAPLLIVISLIYGIRRRNSRRGKTLLLILIYGIGGLINLYPMANAYHFSTCLIPFLLLLPALIPSPIWRQELVSFAAEVVVLAGLFFLVGYIPYDILTNYHLCTTLEQYEGVFISDEMEEDILTVTAYVSAQEEAGYIVYILDNRAASYFLPLHEYHKYFDMFLTGNLGTTDPYELLLDACDENVLFLTPVSGKTEWQYPRSAVTALTRTLTYIETISSFDVYAVTSE